MANPLGSYQLNDPVAGAGGSSGNTVTNPTDSSTSTDPGFLSSLGADLSSFFNSPLGTTAEFGALAGLGLSQANSQKQTNDQLAQSLSTPGQPYTAAGSAELTQLEGGASVGGPLGASITQQTTAAKNLGNVATEYSTGNLTPAQNTQVQDFIKQQRAMVDTQLAASGNTDSSARQAAYQQIDNNAAQLTQELTQQNTTIASAALTSVQQTYSTLLNQALTSSEFGFSTQEAAVMTQIQSDTQLSQSLQQLFGAIAQGFGNAIGGGNKGGGTNVGGAVGNAVGQVARGVSSSASGGGGGGSSGPTDPSLAAPSSQGAINAQNDPSQFSPFDPNATQQYTATTPTSDFPAYTNEFTGDPFAG